MIKNFIQIATKVVWIAVAISMVAGFIIKRNNKQQLIEQYDKPVDYELVTENLFKKNSFAVGLYTAQGYGGKIKALVEVQDSVITKFELVEQSETPSYLKKCEDFLQSFIGKKLNSKRQQIDIVSGATITSSAIIDIFQNLENDYFKSAEKAKRYIEYSISSAVVLFLICISISTYFFKKKRVKKVIHYILICSTLLVVGFWLNLPLTLPNFAQFLTLDLLPFFSNIDFYLILIYALVTVIFTKRNSYCKNICPFGAFQDCTAILLKPNGKVKVSKQFNQLPLLLSGLALIPALLLQAPGLSLYEIYSGIFDFKLSIALYVVFVIIVIMMLFIKRPWCRFFCPTGAILNQILKLTNKVWRK